MKRRSRLKDYEEITQNNNLDKLYQGCNFGKALCESNKLFAEKMMEHTEKIYSWLIVLADSRRLPREEQETKRFMKLLKAQGAKHPERFPVPVISRLPSSIYTWDTFIKSCVEEVKADTFAIVTQAYGTKRRLAREVRGNIQELDPEDRDDYALIQIVENGKQVHTFAAPLIMSLVNRQGDYKQKLGDWNEYKNVEKLAIPTEWKAT